MFSDDDPPPRPGLGATLGGCLVAILFGIYLLTEPLFLWGQSGALCAPGRACRLYSDGWFALRVAAALVPIVLLGLSVRALLHWMGRRNVAGAEGAGRLPRWVVPALTAALVGGLLYLSWYWQ